MTHTYTLPGGMRLVCCQAHTAGIYLGIAIDWGTRDELPTESGMAHFTEHMTFKGTHHRTAMQILRRLEGVGGELNAYTGKEETVYYAAVQPRHLKRAIDLLMDIVFCSTYPQEEMQREVEVVCDEIESYNDSPAELIFDDFDALLFGKDAPLGRSILGDADTLRRHTSADMAAFARRGYRPGNAVLFVLGDVEPDKVIGILSNSPSTSPLTPVLSPKGEGVVSSGNDDSSSPLGERAGVRGLVEGLRRVEARGLHQAHVMMGCRTIGMKHEDRRALQLLNNILGGPGMNSRLNLALRERSGLVYTVESNYTGYTDTGTWSIYFGCDHSDVRRCQRLALRELDKLCQSPLRPATLAAAKRQMLGQMALGYDQHESMAIATGKAFLHYGHAKTQEQIAQEIEAITAEQLHRVACETFNPAALSTLIYE